MELREVTRQVAQHAGVLRPLPRKHDSELASGRAAAVVHPFGAAPGFFGRMLLEQSAGARQQFRQVGAAVLED